MMGNMMEVVGIGTVELPTKTLPNLTGPDSHGTLRLKMVLHCPSARCNIVGVPITGDYGVIVSGYVGASGHAGTVTGLSDRRPVAYFMPSVGSFPLLEVQLSEPPVGPVVGPSPFNPSQAYIN
ncbi:hypothetical protein ASPZODRAFT_891110 [Penicilliopsis zonata CBS 506.65]|uniref:Uncharacterized protein n=1 Tax=Penicilliopsis zonata CBS 506.65 TaxID=1073090 RepID=A0A1L9S9N4_9EURO|nr:hypothetical protein ASPZODRAFT_891110 [Penicilliopsis zonata CBS 506.65]OJJ43881.1 hypothetical protein ASPZODRAFT_891110 [Penicilliopsis zonata CBS 506.65]